MSAAPIDGNEVSVHRSLTLLIRPFTCAELELPAILTPLSMKKRTKRREGEGIVSEKKKHHLFFSSKKFWKRKRAENVVLGFFSCKQTGAAPPLTEHDLKGGLDKVEREAITTGEQEDDGKRARGFLFSLEKKRGRQ